MGGVLDCSADPIDDIDFSNLTGPIVKPLHAMSVKELVYNIQYEHKADLERLASVEKPSMEKSPTSPQMK